MTVKRLNERLHPQAQKIIDADQFPSDAGERHRLARLGWPLPAHHGRAGMSAQCPLSGQSGRWADGVERPSFASLKCAVFVSRQCDPEPRRGDQGRAAGRAHHQAP